MATDRKINENKKLIKSIRIKAELVGASNTINDISHYEGDYSLEAFKELSVLERIMKKRVENYHKITAFFKTLTEGDREFLKEKSDEDFRHACNIIAKCEKAAKLFEIQTGREVKDKTIYLTASDNAFFTTLFAPTEMKKVNGKTPSQNVDEDEEFLTREEIEFGWGDDITLDEVNRTLKVNIHHTT